MRTTVHFHTLGNSERPVIGKFDFTPDEVEDMIYEAIGAGFMTVPCVGHAHSIIIPASSLTRVVVHKAKG